MEVYKFTFANSDDYKRIFKALNDTFYTFYPADGNAVVIYGKPAADDLFTCLCTNGIKHTFEKIR